MSECSSGGELNTFRWNLNLSPRVFSGGFGFLRVSANTVLRAGVQRDPAEWTREICSGDRRKICSVRTTKSCVESAGVRKCLRQAVESAAIDATVCRRFTSLLSPECTHALRPVPSRPVRRCVRSLWTYSSRNIRAVAVNAARRGAAVAVPDGFSDSSVERQRLNVFAPCHR